jgi:ubiquinone/menaquinone biosynthesis C-methylase UbiE
MGDTATDEATADPMDGFREVMRAMWSGVAPSWDAYADDVEDRGRDVSAAMLAATRTGPGMRVLELACGAGGLGIEAARRVGPAGSVLVTDVADAMVAIARRKVDEAGLVSVRTGVMGVEAIDAPDASFDVVLCREGLMFAIDPSRALAEIRRVLRSGGRAAVAVWGPPADNPWLGLVLESASAVLGEPIPPPGLPGPFALADRDALVDRMRAAGLADVLATGVDAPLRCASFDAWWTRCVALAGPLAQRLAALPVADVDAMRARARAAAQSFAADGDYDFPGVSLVVSATRP